MRANLLVTFSLIYFALHYRLYLVGYSALLDVGFAFQHLTNVNFQPKLVVYLLALLLALFIECNMLLIHVHTLSSNYWYWEDTIVIPTKHSLTTLVLNSSILISSLNIRHLQIASFLKGFLDKDYLLKYFLHY